MKLHTSPRVLLLCLAALVAGCSRADDKAGASSPGVLVARFVDAFERLDSAAVTSCLDPSSAGAKAVARVLAAATDMLARQRDFEAAVRARFGDAFLERLAGGPAGVPAGLARRLHSLKRDSRIEVEGAGARLTLPGRPKEECARMVQRDGAWYFAVAPYLPEDPNLCESMEFLCKQFAGRYEEASKLLETNGDKAGFSAALADLDRGLERRTRKVMETVEPFLRRYR